MDLDRFVKYASLTAIILALSVAVLAAGLFVVGERLDEIEAVLERDSATVVAGTAP